MKKYVLTLFLAHISIFWASAQNPDAILGFWQSPHVQTEIVKRGDVYVGISAADTGTVVLKDFKYRGNGIYHRGKVADVSGRTYNGQLKIIGADILRVRIFFGIIQFGRTEIWTRIKR